MKVSQTDCQIILYCKGHFTNGSDPACVQNLIEDLRKIMGRAYGVEPCYIGKDSIIRNLTGLVPVEKVDQRAFLDFVNDVSPQHCWKVGYYVKEDTTMARRADAVNYEYWDAVIHKLVSVISLTKVKYYEGLELAEADLTILA
jgi:hypothetical protein